MRVVPPHQLHKPLIRIRSFMQDTSKPVRPTVMADACLVADVLGPDVRAHLIDRYVALEMKDYRRIFRPVRRLLATLASFSPVAIFRQTKLVSSTTWLAAFPGSTGCSRPTSSSKGASSLENGA